MSSEWMGVKVNGRVVEDSEPCEWEAEPWNVYRMDNEYKTLCTGMNYCPMCGRPLGGDE